MPLQKDWDGWIPRPSWDIPIETIDHFHMENHYFEFIPIKQGFKLTSVLAEKTHGENLSLDFNVVTIWSKRLGFFSSS